MVQRVVASRLLTALIAACIALAVPVSQLRWRHTDRWCCCPDPDACQCPHDEPSPDAQLGPCHGAQASIVSPGQATFTPPPVLATLAPLRVIERAEHAIAIPHAPPTPRRPDAPS